MYIVEMQFIVPARYGQPEEIIDKLKDIGDGVCLYECLLIFLNELIVITLFLINNIHNNLLKVSVKSPDIDLTQLLLCLIYLFILNDILVN